MHVPENLDKIALDNMFEAYLMSLVIIHFFEPGDNENPKFEYTG
jgi:hypothetical protein